MIRLTAAACAAAALLAGGPVSAQTAMNKTTSEMPVKPATAPAASAAGAMSLDTPIETIAANPAGKAVLDKDLPGLTTHPMYDSFKSMSLKEVQPMSQGAIGDDAMKKAGADLAALPPK